MINGHLIRSNPSNAVWCELLRKVVVDFRLKPLGCQPCEVELDAIKANVDDEGIAAIQKVEAFITDLMTCLK